MVKEAEWYLEHQTKYWYIKVHGTSTVVQAGKKGCEGRTAQDHKKKAAAELFAKCQVKQKEKKGYILQSALPPFLQASRGSGKSKAATQSKAAPSKPKPEKKSVKAQKKAPGKNQASPASKTSNKQTRQTSGEDEIYIPPRDQWPVEIDAPEVMSMCKKELGFGVFADDTRCLVGFDNGWVYELSLSGTLVCKYKLHDGVKCITKDGDFVYVGCNDGGLYDLTHREPRLMCKVEDFGEVCVLHIHQGLIAAGDDNGSIALVNYEGETIWKKEDGDNDTWLARLDEDTVYHGCGPMVYAYRCTDGKQIWKFETEEDCITYGELDEDYVYACTSSHVYKLNKKTGKLIQRYINDHLSSIMCNGVDDYGMVLAGGSWNNACALVCFDGESGDIIYVLKKNPDYANYMTLQYHKGRVYLVGDNGFQCIDLTEEAIKNDKKKPVGKKKKVPTATLR